METVNEYLDHVKARTGSKSDSNLAHKIGIHRQKIHQYRTSHCHPTNEVMLALAERANLDPAEALILLNLWKAEGEAKAIYKRLFLSTIAQASPGLKKFGVIIGLTLLFSSPLASNDAQAAANTQFFEELPRAENSHNAEVINIMRLLTEFLRALSRTFLNLSRYWPRRWATV